MKAMILRVLKCGEVISVKSEKSENGILRCAEQANPGASGIGRQVRELLRGDGAGQSGNADL